MSTPEYPSRDIEADHGIHEYIWSHYGMHVNRAPTLDTVMGVAYPVSEGGNTLQELGIYRIVHELIQLTQRLQSLCK